MAYLPIYRGAQPNDNTGDNLREGARKINANFSEIYTALGTGSVITFNVNSYVLNNITDVDVPLPIHEQVLSWDANSSKWIAVDKLSGNVVGHMIPDANNMWDLGDMANNFRDIYLSGNAIFNPGAQRVFSDNGVLKVQYDYQTSNAVLLNTADSTAASITPGSPSDDVYFSNTTVMDSVTVGGTTIYVFPGIDLSTSAPYGLLPNLVVELTLANNSFSNVYTNYSESVYGAAPGTHADAFYFSGPTSVTVKNGALAPANTAQIAGRIYDDLLNADVANLKITRISSDGIGEFVLTNKTQTLTNKTILAANNSILMSIGDLFDVTTSGANTASDGQILTWKAAENRWSPANTSTPFDPSSISTDLLPASDSTYNLGSPTHKFHSLYLANNSLHIGNSTVSEDANGFIEFSSPIKLGSSTNNVTVRSSIIPDSDSTYNLGSPTNKFHSLYLANSTIYLGESAISSGPDGLSFIEKTTQLVHIVEKNVFTFNPNTDIDYPFANTVTGYIQPDQLNIYSIKGLSDAASNSNFFDVPGLENLGFGFRIGVSLDSQHFIFDLPMYTAKLNIYAFNDFNNPILSFDFLQPFDINSNQNYFVDPDGFHTVLGKPIPEGFVLGANGEVYIISDRTPQDFEMIFAPFQNAIAGMYSPAPGINVQLEVYFTDPVKSVPKPIKPVDTPAAISSGSAPASNTASGTAGDMVVDSGYLYICHTDDMWVRLPVETTW